MLKIDHPQIYIYSYQHLSESQTEVDSIWTWANTILHDFSPNSTPFSSSENLNDVLSDAEKFSDSTKTINGSFRFCHLDDSVGILARIGSPETDENKGLETKELAKFNPNNIIVSQSDAEWLGQTIFITYKSKTYQELSKQTLREVADECLNNLFPEGFKRPPFCRDTELFNSPIFEYSFPQNKLQVFVYRIDDEIEKKLESLIQPIFELFFHRHKIINNFITSRETYKLAHSFYQYIETNIEDLEANLESENKQFLPELKAKIKQSLRDQLDYQKFLAILENIDNTINIHVYNYQQKLSEIGDKCQLKPEGLTTFNLFIKKTVPYIQRQIKGDLGYFQHGTSLIDTAIASIRGIVEIEQAESDRIWQEQEKERDRELQKTLQSNEIEEKERDRNLQTIVAVVGVGIGAAGVAATASPYILQPNPKDNSYYLGISLLFSLVAGLIGVAIAARVMRHLQNPEKKEIHPRIKFILKLILGIPEQQPATTTESNKSLPTSESEAVTIPQQPESARSPTSNNN